MSNIDMHYRYILIYIIALTLLKNVYEMFGAIHIICYITRSMVIKVDST